MAWLLSKAMIDNYANSRSLPAPAAECSVVIYLDGVRFALLKATPTPPLRWPSGKMTEFSRPSRYGMTFAPLMGSSGAHVLMSFRVDFHAKTSAWPEPVTESLAAAPGSGSTWRASFAKFDPDTHSWRTPQLSLLEDSAPYSQTWPRWGSMRNGECSERPISELRTSATGSGLLPTPSTIDDGARFNQSPSPGSQRRPTLGAMAKYDLWPTPRATDGSHGGRVTERKGREGGNLVEAVSARTKWPTPTVKGNHNKAGLTAKSGDGLATAVNRDSKGGQLNPAWIEWLMGLPAGWTALEPLEMRKFQEWLRQHSPSYHNDTMGRADDDT